MRDFSTIDSRGKEGKQVTPSVPGNDAPQRNHLYVLRADDHRQMIMRISISYNFFLVVVMSSF